jgi:predicted O-linked N-acetylglucosamine transferase (SPINDLY family)
MAQSTHEILLRQAVEHLQSGRTQPAIDLLVQIASADVREPRSRFMLGLIAQMGGQFDTALNWLNQSIQLDPSQAEPYFVIGVVHQIQKKWPAAIEAYRNAIARKAADPKALNNLGRCLLDSGATRAAIETLTTALVTFPTHAGMLTNLGDAYRVTGDFSAATDCYHRAIQADPKCADAHASLGVTLFKIGGRLSEAVACLRRSIAVNPKSFGPRFNLARVLQDSGQLEEALRECQAALEIRPDSADALNLLGNLFGIAGRIPECIAAQRRAVELKPDFAGTHSNLLLSMQYLPEISPGELYDAHLKWAARHAPVRAEKSPSHTLDLSTRRLRLGYISPNFNAHSVACFFQPVLAAHNRQSVEIFCYSDVTKPDAITLQLKELAEHWRDIAGQSDAQVVAMIRQDKLDVLIDLAGHTAQNRLPVFACKPAPVQMTWLGYPGTTGMKQMDYRLTDPIADPPGFSDQIHTEKLVRLDGGCWAYHPQTAPPIAPFPSVANGYVTFGSFNNLPKVTPQVIKTWARILSQVPGSQLILKCAGFSSSLGRKYISQQFDQHGISADRVEQVIWLASSEAHLNLYGRIDLALDTFPYNGTTTTCEALWMGVPVITLTGNTHVSRVGTALLAHVGLSEWIARDIDSYIELAVRSAQRLTQLTELRLGLRDRFKSSPLGDATRLARQLEAIIREKVTESATQSSGSEPIGA